MKISLEKGQTLEKGRRWGGREEDNQYHSGWTQLWRQWCIIETPEGLDWRHIFWRKTICVVIKSQH